MRVMWDLWMWLTATGRISYMSSMPECYLKLTLMVLLNFDHFHKMVLIEMFKGRVTGRKPTRRAWLIHLSGASGPVSINPRESNRSPSKDVKFKESGTHKQREPLSSSDMWTRLGGVQTHSTHQHNTNINHDSRRSSETARARAGTVRVCWGLPANLRMKSQTQLFKPGLLFALVWAEYSAQWWQLWRIDVYHCLFPTDNIWTPGI